MRQLKITKQLTNRESRSIEKYLSEVSRESMITPEEEVELAERIQTGDGIALQKLVNANLRFVISVAKQYQGHGMTLEDIIAEGNIGLITAAKRFDHTKGFKFISYAVWWIRQSIMSAIAENSRTIRLPQNKVGHVRKMAQTTAVLEQELERSPTNEEIAERMETEGPDIDKLAAYSQKQVSVDAPLLDGEENSLLNVLKNDSAVNPTDGLMRESLGRDIDRVLECLKGREADVIRLSFGLNSNPPMSLEEIATKMGLTRERIRQIREKALRSLRKGSNSHLLKQYQ